ncbi:uncharacterized protein GIQ15_03273 [Arthroderma uncinatum]|uniref:uncharacterized protein n=1 Tax=Arthroderma uncinatum TaxID=74035 RepID=UPI00144AE254|nr:uncharacterized protein GIQ15_03273 [Arthroderma uncinatum]KAF3483949.1 hypothetical protein GIQ15_03273 [Arthroderma uncinatum]
MEGLTASEQRIFTLGMLCATDGLTSIKVDYDKLAIQAGLKNAACALVLFNKSKRKILQGIAENASGAAGNKTPNKKAATGDKVTKPPKSRAKGKATTNEGDTEESNVDAVDTTPVKAAKPKGARANGRAKGAAKVKRDPENEIISIKHEAEIKTEPFTEDFAKGIIDGTFYPCTGEKLNNLWVAGTGPTAFGTPFDSSELDDSI